MRLIDADALREEHCKGCHDDIQQDCKTDPVCASLMWVHEAPTIDAVPVVRCKDCGHGRPIDKTKAPERYYRDDCIVCQCENVVGDEPMVYIPTHFCSYGERRSDEDEDS